MAACADRLKDEDLGSCDDGCSPGDTVQIIAAQADVGRPGALAYANIARTCHELSLQSTAGAHTPEVLQDTEFADIDVFLPHDASMAEPRVDARKLHQNLGSKQQFGNWMDNRIADLELVKTVDYGVFNNPSKNPQGGRPNKEYSLTMDTAKEMAMLERNEQGKRIRRYFIACEKRLRQSSGLIPAFDTGDPLSLRQHGRPHTATTRWSRDAAGHSGGTDVVNKGALAHRFTNLVFAVGHLSASFATQ